MDLIGKIITHKSWGQGTIREIAQGYIITTFEIGEKKLKFSDAFSYFLTIEDADANTYIQRLIAEKAERQKIELKEKYFRQEQMKNSDSSKLTSKNTKLKRANIAFKCKYCDGGKSDTQIGFKGVCSDEIIYNNICVEKRTWCNSDCTSQAKL